MHMRSLSAFASMAIIGLTVPSIASAHPPVALVMDQHGNVFYSDLSRVWMIAPNGQKSIAVPNVHSHELFLDTDGTLYGEHVWYEGERANKWGHRVWKRTQDGTITNVIPPTDGFLTGYSFVRDRVGTMYWAERLVRTEIRKRRAKGPVSIHSRGPFRDIRWMTASADGTLYLIDNGDLRKVLPDGTVSTVALKIASRSITRLNVGKQHSVMGLWLDSTSNVYAAIYGSGEVKRIAPDGTITRVARSRLPWSPTGGMTASNGDLWILETSITNAVRVRKVSRNGAVTTY